MSLKRCRHVQKMRDEFKSQCYASRTEINSSASSSRFNTVELNSNFWLKLVDSDELNRGDSKLVCPKLPFLYYRAQEASLKKSRLSSSGVKLVFSIKMATDFSRNLACDFHSFLDHQKHHNFPTSVSMCQSKRQSVFILQQFSGFAVQFTDPDKEGLLNLSPHLQSSSSGLLPKSMSL